MRGIKSFGMLLCASDAEHTVVEPLSPPAAAPLGERLAFCGLAAGALMMLVPAMAVA